MNEHEGQRLTKLEAALRDLTARLAAFHPTAEGFVVGSTRLFEKLVAAEYHLHQRDSDGSESDLTGAKSLQGVPLSETAPTAGQYYAYDAALDMWVPTAPGAPGAHALGGASHTADTLANLNTKVSDATLDKVGDARPPTSHTHDDRYYTETEHGGVSPQGHHAAVTLAADAEVLLGLTGQQLTLDSQDANKVLAGPAAGAAADPTFRLLVAADIPGGGGAPHNLLDGATHPDTAAGTVVAGDLVVGNATPKWARLAKGTTTYVLKAGAAILEWGQVAWGEITGKPSTFPPEAHKTSHQDAGADEISVAGLSGLLADDQHVLDAEAIAAVEAEATLDLTGAVTIAAGKSLATDTIAEKTAATGVTIDGSKIKDFLFYPDPTGHPNMLVGAAAGWFWFSYDANNVIAYNSGTGFWHITAGGATRLQITPTYISTTALPIQNVADPTNAQDAATKAYADTKIAKSLVDAKGDLIAATAADTVARKAVGTDGQALIADSSQADGLKYADREIRIAFVIPTDTASTTVPQPGSPTLPACTITKVEVELDKNETCGATSLIIDIHKVPSANKNTDGQGTTMYTTQANRPTVSNGNKYANATLPDVTAFAAGDVPKVYVDQVGTSVTACTVIITAKVSP